MLQLVFLLVHLGSAQRQEQLNRVEYHMVWVIFCGLLPSLFFTARQAVCKHPVCFWRCSISSPHLMILGEGGVGFGGISELNVSRLSVLPVAIANLAIMSFEGGPIMCLVL